MTVDSDMEKARSTNNFTQYSYPLTPGQHNMVLVFKDYNYKSATSSGFVRGEDRSVSAKIDASVSLPIPNNLTDTYNVKVGPYELGVTGALALDTLGGTGRADLMADARKAFSAGSEGGVDTGDAVSTAGSTFKVASAFMGRNVLDKLPGAGGINTAIDMRTGNTVNPHVALKFDGVDLKQHTFNWQLSPRSEAEARQLKTFYNSSKPECYQHMRSTENLQFQEPFSLILIWLTSSLQASIKTISITSSLL